MWLVSHLFSGKRKEGSNAVREVDLPGIGMQRVMRSLDCIGAACPRPQLYANKVLGELDRGDVIEVVSDNPTSVEGFPFLAQALNCDYLGVIREQKCWRIYFRKC